MFEKEFRKYYSKWKSLEKKLQNNLKLLKIPTRKNASSGLWLSFLLPCTLLTSGLKYQSECSDLFWHFSLLSVSFITSSACGILHHFNSFQFPFKQIGIIVSMSITSLLLTLYSFQGYGMYANLLHSFIFSVSYHPLLELLLNCLKNSFTYGEVSIVTQAVLLFQTHAYTNLYILFNGEGQQMMSCKDTALLILQFGLTCVVLLVSLVYTFKTLRSPIIFYVTTLFCVTFGAVIPLHFMLGTSPVLWMVNLLFSDSKTIYLVFYWLFCVLVAILIINLQASTNKKASTSLRKYFHLLAVAVYIPGFIVNRCLLYLASAVVFALFIILDMIRLLKLPPFGDILDKSFQLYVDEKDSNVALTPMYLLIGCSLPLWLHPQTFEKCSLLSLTAGILSIGVGDCFASMIGYRFGKHKWKNSKKSIEGSVACFVSQVCVVLSLINLGFIPWSELYIAVIGIGIVTIVEAKTDQVDNLILPLIQYFIFV